MKTKKMLRMTALALCLCLATGCAAEPTAADPGERLELLSINVGKADCHLLYLGDEVYLIDAGTWQSWGAVSAALRANGIDHLDGVFLTHTDKDHAGGLPALIQAPVKVDAWYASAYFCEVTAEEHPMNLVTRLRGQEVTYLKAGDTLPQGGGRLTVLGPTQYFADKENNNSLVLLAETAEGSILLTGDMETPAEELLLRAGTLQPVTVLKVGHHAEGDATSEAFARTVRPRLAVISTNSEEEPDTPSSRVVKLLKAVGARLASTQSAAGGVRVTVRGGDAQAALESWSFPEAVAGVEIADLDTGSELLTLRNGGAETVDLGGWFITSSRGGETFVFPAGQTLAPGQSLTVSTLSSPSRGDLQWPEEKVWANKKQDTATLYDAWGRQMSER